jgi:ribosomal protein S18 acetylase RimI-like enzyme
MLEIICDPPARSKGVDSSFLQSVRMVDGDDLIAHARWQAASDPAHGVAQLLELWVSPARRRQGYGRKLMDAVTAQAVEHFRSRKSPLRRMWMAVEQKQQVIGRSFLMQFGFNHVGTVSELLKDEDLLVYMRTFN